jgi:hypothetical protein
MHHVCSLNNDDDVRQDVDQELLLRSQASNALGMVYIVTVEV